MPSAPAAQKISPRMSLVLALLVAASFLNYIDRGNLSIAATMIQDELGISAEKLGFLLSAFFWTYAALQPLAGWLVDRFEVAYIFAAGFFLWSAATALTGLVHIFATLLAVRLLLGVGESIAYPSYSRILVRHLPESRLGLANALIAAGVLLGPGFGIFAGGNLMARFGWRPFFVVLGLASMVWLPAWAAAMPRKNTRVIKTETSSITIGQFLRLRAAWGACGGHFANNYISYFMITWLPYYLVRERGFSLQSMARIGALAYLLGAAACTLSGWLSDRWIKAGGDASRVRKTFLSALGVSGIVVAFTPLGTPNTSAAILILATVLFAVGNSHIFVAAQTLAGPEAAGRWTGMQNFAGNLAGPIAPALTGVVLQRTGNFTAPFVIAAAVLIFGVFCWCVVVKRIEPVDWTAVGGVNAANDKMTAASGRGSAW